VVKTKKSNLIGIGDFSMPLLKAAQFDRPVYILLLGVLLSHLGTYLVIPILPIVLTTEMNISIGRIGVILASISIFFQIGSILGGYLADRIGRRVIIGLGAFIGALGLFGLAAFNDYYLLVIMAAILGLGNGLNAPSTKASIASIVAKEKQTTAFSLRGIFANIGTGSAGLIVFLLITGSSKVTFWIAGFIYILSAILSWIFLPNGCGDAPCPEIQKGAYSEVFKNRPFLVFGVLIIFIWALYTQLSLALPLRAASVLANPENVALVWTINSLIVISTQSFLSKRFIQTNHPLNCLAVGLLFIGAGVGSLFWAHSFIALALCGIIFVFGEMLIMPTIDSIISQLSKAELIGVFFGLANVIFGLGEAGGRFVGSNLLEIGSEIGYLPWAIYGLTGMILSLLVLSIKRWKPLQTSLEQAAEKEDAPRHSPKVPIDQIRSHPLDRWEPEMFFRKRRET
jgi:MFS family permease